MTIMHLCDPKVDRSYEKHASGGKTKSARDGSQIQIEALAIFLINIWMVCG